MFDRIRDHFKSDQQLMQEEVALFAVIMQNDDIEQAGGTPPRLPKSHYNNQSRKLTILCQRGHVVDGDGGWKS